MSSVNTDSEKLHFIKATACKNWAIVMANSHLYLYWDKSPLKLTHFPFWFYLLSHALLNGKWETKTQNTLLRGRDVHT